MNANNGNPGGATQQPPVTPAAPTLSPQAQVQQDMAMKKQQEEAAKAMIKNSETAANSAKVAERVFYSRVAGSTYYFKNGNRASFANGQYVTNDKVEIDELEALCKQNGNHLIVDEPVEIQNRSDALILKEVGAGGTGTVSSAHLNQLATARR